MMRDETAAGDPRGPWVRRCEAGHDGCTGGDFEAWMVWEHGNESWVCPFCHAVNEAEWREFDLMRAGY